MGRRAKDKQLVAQATRRRTVLQIDRVSRRETGEGPSSSGPARAINPNSISGIGLLGSYADDSDAEEEGDYDASEDQSGPSILEEESTVASSSSVGPQPEIDAKLADFFNEIASMDADTTTVTDDRKTSRQAEEVVSSTTEDEAVYQQGGDYSANEADLYPWHPCLDETTNCYYYWNVETNEVQWEPPPQLLAVADAQTTNDSKVTEEENNVEFEYNKEDERQEDEESMYQRNGNFDTYKELENEENQVNALENDDKQANSKGNTDDDIDGCELLDFKEEEQQAECVEKKEASTRKSDVIFADDDIPAKRPKLLAAESDDSDDDFATQLLEDTYENGKQDVVKEKKMDLPDEEDKEMKQGNVAKDEETESEKPLLPPEVFEHLKNSETGEKKEDKIIMEEKAPKYDVEEAEYKQQIMELTSVLTNKLDFLEISRKDVSSLKILFIEMETRISDWREGALDSRHFINKLCEADAQLKQYEESAAPPGWTCHWDRTHKRYYYTNEVTGDSQWEFPSEEFGGEMEIDAAIEEATPSTQVAEAIGTDEQANVPVWSYPATYVPLVQAQVMPVVMATAPVVSSSATAGSFVNPPVPGTECGSEVVPFTASAYFPVAEEPPPPPPGTDDLPPLPPAESSAPPPPPPEPLEAPPPPPMDDIPESTESVIGRISSPFVSGQPTVSTLSNTLAPVPRSLVDYSDLDTAVASPPGSSVHATSAQGTGRLMQEISDLGPTSSTGVPIKTKVKKKKKTSKVGSSLLSSKARKVSSLVQKWQSIKQQEEPVLDSSEEEEEVMDPRQQIEEWKREQLASGQAAYNPNFEEIKGDWRERIRARGAKSGYPTENT